MADFGKGSELLELESVQRAIDEAALWAGSEYARKQRGWFRYGIGKDYDGQHVESPIEAVFLAWFYGVGDLDDNQHKYFFLRPQQKVTLASGKKCRFDFTIGFGGEQILPDAAAKGIPEPKVAIELDGHDFHERTKAQVAERNTRDRDAQADGWTILHYSGSELYRDPVQCVSGALDICGSKYEEWLSHVYPHRD